MKPHPRGQRQAIQPLCHDAVDVLVMRVTRNAFKGRDEAPPSVGVGPSTGAALSSSGHRRHAPAGSLCAIRRLARIRSALQEVEGFDAEPLRQVFERPESQIALTTFERAHIGAVESELLGQRLLADTEFCSVLTNAPPQGLLQVSAHSMNCCAAPLIDLQTDK